MILQCDIEDVDLNTWSLVLNKVIVLVKTSYFYTIVIVRIKSWMEEPLSDFRPPPRNQGNESDERGDRTGSSNDFQASFVLDQNGTTAFAVFNKPCLFTEIIPQRFNFNPGSCLQVTIDETGVVCTGNAMFPILERDQLLDCLGIQK